MKLSYSFAAGLLAVGLLAGTSQAANTISGSAHDFGTKAWSGNQICLPCHTPHNSILKDANGVLLDGPMWNHTLSSATYTLYSQNQTDASGKLVIDPVSGLPVIQGVTGNVDQNSKLCLSCHDGTVALDSFNNINGSPQTGSNYLTGTSNLGTDFSNDHPIGDHAAYPTTDGKTSTDPANFVAPQLSGFPRLRMMANGKLVVGCTSCHNPHGSGTPRYPHLLSKRVDIGGTTPDGRTVNGSLLCQSCHIK